MVDQRATVGGAPPPPGVIPDYFHQHTALRTSTIYCQALCYSIVTCIVLIRLYTKIYITKKLEKEDYACILAWVAAIGLSALALGCLPVGGGVHQWNVPAQNVPKFLQIQYFAQLLYYSAAFLTKSSILFLIARIFSPHNKIVITTRIIIGLMFAFYLPMFFLKVFRCKPLHKYWNVKAEGTCINGTNIFIADGVVSVLSDFAILLLPMPLVWRLQLSKKRKLKLIIVFGSGALACATNVAQLIFYFKLAFEEDATYGVMLLLLLAIAEVNLGIICCCLPIIPIFFQRLTSADKSRTSQYPSYLRLERLNPSQPWVETMKSDSSKADQWVAESNGMASAQERPIGRLEVSVFGGVDARGGERLWNGEGILRTVDIEQSGIEMPKHAHVMQNRRKAEATP